VLVVQTLKPAALASTTGDAPQVPSRADQGVGIQCWTMSAYLPNGHSYVELRPAWLASMAGILEIRMDGENAV
jgi:hypothetical protein